MRLQKFIDKYNGKFVEVAGSSNALNQCVDLANAYLREVLGQPIVEWTNAVDFPEKIGEKFEWIPNTPEAIVQKGDIIVWGKGVGTNGHIAIAIDGTLNKFNSFDQNYPLNTPAHIQGHYYKNVRGWLRLKGGDSDMDDDCRSVRDSHWNDLIAIKESLGLDGSTPIDTTLKSIAGIKGEAKQAREKVAVLEQEVKNRKEETSRVEKELLASELGFRETIKRKDQEIGELRSRVQGLKEQIETISKEKGITLNELAKCQAGQIKHHWWEHFIWHR